MKPDYVFGAAINLRRGFLGNRQCSIEFRWTDYGALATKAAQLVIMRNYFPIYTLYGVSEEFSPKMNTPNEFIGRSRRQPVVQ